MKKLFKSLFELIKVLFVFLFILLETIIDDLFDQLDIFFDFLKFIYKLTPRMRWIFIFRFIHLKLDILVLNIWTDSIYRKILGLGEILRDSIINNFVVSICFYTYCVSAAIFLFYLNSTVILWIMMLYISIIFIFFLIGVIAVCLDTLPNKTKTSIILIDRTVYTFYTSDNTEISIKPSINLDSKIITGILGISVVYGFSTLPILYAYGNIVYLQLFGLSILIISVLLALTSLVLVSVYYISVLTKVFIGSVKFYRFKTSRRRRSRPPQEEDEMNIVIILLLWTSSVK